MAKLPSDNQPDPRVAPDEDDNDSEREAQDFAPGSPNATKVSPNKSNVTTSSRIKNN